MKKKHISLILTIACFATFLYFYDLEEEVTKINDSTEQKVKSPYKSTTPSQTQTNKNIENKPLESSETSEEDMQKYSKYLDEIEESWNDEITNIFMSDSENGETNLTLYKELKRGFEAEREKRYEDFHNQMREKHGDSYSYSPSVDEEMFNEKLVKAYEKALSEKIGKEKMIEYMSLKDSFNEKLENENKSKDDFFTSIDF